MQHFFNPLNYTLLIKKFPSWFYKLACQMYIDYNFPRHIFIETTTRCNLNCWHCPRPKIEKDMSDEIFYKIIDEAMEYGARSFSLHLFGEPLLDKKIYKRICTIKNANPKNNIILTTNGAIINPDVFDTLDKIIITYNPHLHNFSDFIQWKKKIMWRTFEDNKYIFPYGQVERKILHNYGGNIQIEKKDGIKNSLDRCACYHLWLAPAIAWNGDILWCCNDPQHKTVWENIKKHTLKDFWQSDELKILREEHKEGIYREPCKSCNVWQTYPSIF